MHEEIKCDERLCASCGAGCAHSHHSEEIERKPVSVEDMALRREARAARQAALLRLHGVPVICFTMNIAGPVKYSAAVENCFNVGAEALEEALSRFNLPVLHREFIAAHTGCEGFWCVKGAAKLIKALTVKIEEELSFSRLFDMDVIGTDGVKLARPKPRKCLICRRSAAECARSRAHSLEELGEKTSDLLREAAAYAASRTARRALEEEVMATPKAGLVDLNNNGANSDMYPELFIKSAEAVSPYFYLMAYNAADTRSPESGHGEGCTRDEHINCADCPTHEACGLTHGASLMTKLTLLGVEAEARMKEATGGVNTHKGAIFCIGLLASAYARLVALDKPHEALDIIEEAKRMAALRPEPGRGTNGAAVRESFTSRGPMGADTQARAGFPAAVNAYRRVLGYRLMGFDDNACYALALIGVMAELYDTNAYSRGGLEGAEYVRTRAADIMAMPLSKRLPEVISFDRELISRNINCGGAADMLAAAIFLDRVTVYSDRRRGEEGHAGAHE